MSKYHNKKVLYKDMIFDSKKERDYYIILEMLEKNGKISDLKWQVPFELQPKFKFKGKTIRAITYIADFTYIDKKNKLHIIDVKSEATKKDKVYRLKKKMMQYKGYDIEEI